MFSVISGAIICFLITSCISSGAVVVTAGIDVFISAELAKLSEWPPNTLPINIGNEQAYWILATTAASTASEGILTPGSLNSPIGLLASSISARVVDDHGIIIVVSKLSELAISLVICVVCEGSYRILASSVGSIEKRKDNEKSHGLLSELGDHGILSPAV